MPSQMCVRMLISPVEPGSLAATSTGTLSWFLGPFSLGLKSSGDISDASLRGALPKVIQLNGVWEGCVWGLFGGEPSLKVARGARFCLPRPCPLSTQKSVKSLSTDSSGDNDVSKVVLTSPQAGWDKDTGRVGGLRSPPLAQK